ncbi:hypothetical protein ACWGBX_28715, partial [Streptomyces sp. NPDC055037]
VGLRGVRPVGAPAVGRREPPASPADPPAASPADPPPSADPPPAATPTDPPPSAVTPPDAPHGTATEPGRRPAPARDTP